MYGCKNAPVYTARIYGPYIRPVYTGSVYRLLEVVGLSFYRYRSTWSVNECSANHRIDVETYSAFTLGRISLDKSLHMRLKTLLASRHVVQWKRSHYAHVERHALKNVHNVSKNVSVLLNGTVHTQTHVSAHFDTQCDVIEPTKYRRCRRLCRRTCVRVLSH